MDVSWSTNEAISGLSRSLLTKMLVCVLTSVLFIVLALIVELSLHNPDLTYIDTSESMSIYGLMESPKQHQRNVL